MPRIMLQSPWGTSYRIDARGRDILQAWFSEILPLVNGQLGQHDVPPALVNVYPLVLEEGPGPDFDWPADSRVITKLYQFPVRTGLEGMAALDKLKAELEAEVAKLRGTDGRV